MEFLGNNLISLKIIWKMLKLIVELQHFFKG